MSKHWMEIEWSDEAGTQICVYHFGSAREMMAFDHGISEAINWQVLEVLQRHTDDAREARCECCGGLLRGSVPVRFDDVPGNEHVKRAVEVAIAGQHAIGILAERANFGNAQALGRVAAEHGATAFVVKPCPCGNFASQRCACTCDIEGVIAHQRSSAYQNARNADIYVEAPAPYSEKIKAFIAGRRGEADEWMLERVKIAAGVEVEGIDEVARTLLAAAVRHGFITADATDRVQDIAATIARLAGDRTIQAAHMAEALQYQVDQSEG